MASVMLVPRSLASSRASLPTSGSRMLMPMLASVYTRVTGCIYKPGVMSMVVPRRTCRLGEALIGDRGLQHHALVELRHHLALDLLPGRLALRIVVAAMLGERGAPLGEFGIGDKNIRRPLLEIDSHAVA